MGNTTAPTLQEQHEKALAQALLIHQTCLDLDLEVMRVRAASVGSSVTFRLTVAYVSKVMEKGGQEVAMPFIRRLSAAAGIGGMVSLAFVGLSFATLLDIILNQRNNVVEEILSGVRNAIHENEVLNRLAEVQLSLFELQQYPNIVNAGGQGEAANRVYQNCMNVCFNLLARCQANNANTTFALMELWFTAALAAQLAAELRFALPADNAFRVSEEFLRTCRKRLAEMGAELRVYCAEQRKARIERTFVQTSDNAHSDCTLYWRDGPSGYKFPLKTKELSHWFPHYFNSLPEVKSFDAKLAVMRLALVDNELREGMQRDQWFQLRNRRSGKLLKLDQEHWRIIQFDEVHNCPGQQWNWRDNLLVSHYSTLLVLDAEGGRTEPTTRIIPSWEHRGSNQQWTFSIVEPGFVSIIGASGSLLGICEGSVDNNAEAVLFAPESRDENYTQWELVEQGGGGAADH